MGQPKPNPKRAEKHQLGSEARRHPQTHHSKVRTSFSSSHATTTISINATKTKIRNLRRALSHASTLPAGVRVEKERALDGYRHDLDRAVEEKKRSEMIGKYHMVRFFERKKAERAVKRARARLTELEDDGGGEGMEGEKDSDGRKPAWKRRKRLQQGVHVAEVDLNYTMYYPLMEKYVSLFLKREDVAGGKDDDDDDDDINDEIDDDTDREGSDSIIPPNKPPLWAFVEQCMVSGTLEKLRDGKLGVKANGSMKMETQEEFGSPEAPHSDHDGGKKKEKKNKAQKNDAATSKGNNADEDDDNSDGGFFEY